MSEVTRTRVRGTPLEKIDREANERDARLPEATMDEIEAAIELLGNEIARRSAIADLTGQPDVALASALDAIVWVEWVLKGTLEPEDFHDLARNVRESLDRMLAQAETA